MKSKKNQWYNFLISDLVDDEKYAQFRRILVPTGIAIVEAAKRIDEAEKDFALDEIDEDHFESVQDEEAHFVEDLLGVTFVIAQSQIEQVVTKVKKINERLKRDTGSSLKFPTTRNSLIKNFNPKISSLQFTGIEVIEAGGNLFKHSSQWSPTWDTNNPNIKVLQGVGCTQYSTGNFRTLFRALEIKDYKKVDLLESKVWDWANNLHTEIVDHLRNYGFM